MATTGGGLFDSVFDSVLCLSEWSPQGGGCLTVCLTVCCVRQSGQGRGGLFDSVLYLTEWPRWWGVV